MTTQKEKEKEKEEVKCNLQVYHMDETETWDHETVKKYPAIKIIAVYLVNESVNTYLCEMSPSKYGYFIANYLSIPESFDDDLAKQLRDQFENEGYDTSGEDIYFKIVPLEKSKAEFTPDTIDAINRALVKSRDKKDNSDYENLMQEAKFELRSDANY